jgi:DNA-binding NtrC family response regulator
MATKACHNQVLIADCQEDVLITFERLLEDKGDDAATAGRGQDALKTVQDQVFDLALEGEHTTGVGCSVLVVGSRLSVLDFSWRAEPAAQG